MSLPAVALYVVTGLHLSNAFGGLAVGIAFVSTIATRGAAGSLADRTGGKRCMQYGLGVYTLAGVVCAAAAVPGVSVATSYAVLLAGRLLLGVGESLAMVGMIGWAIGIMGQARSGLVLSAVGAGMYGAFACGGPLGVGLLARWGFAPLMFACAVLPLAAFAAVAWIPGITPSAGRRESFWNILARMWRHGATVGLQGVGFAALGAFFALYVLSRHWPYAGLGLTCFGSAFVLVRFACGRLPDRIGGTPVAVVSLVVEACGQYLLWLAPLPWTALLGAFLTGAGCSMVFPAMGSEVVKAVPPHLRATAIGAFAAFQDVAYGATGPVVGLLADSTGYAAVFLIGGLAATAGIAMALSARPVNPGRARISAREPG